MDPGEEGDPADEALLAQCRARALALLRANLAPEGILACADQERARQRHYRSVFGRDAAICALAMATSGEPSLVAGAVAGLATLAAHQAPNGQIPKLVHHEPAEPDFWYLGCLDASLWWLVAVDALDRTGAAPRLRERFAREAGLALRWLQAQEHQRFFLLQQNEASDWADIMPRSGFVLYSNALWLEVKRRWDVPGREATREHANRLLRPFGPARAADRRAELLAAHAREHARDRGAYLSYVNFASFGDEGDVLGNALAVLFGLPPEGEAAGVMRALQAEGVDEPYPVRVTCEPIEPGSPQWRPYMARHGQNFAWQYHNGGIWPFAGGFWVAALARAGLADDARRALVRLARANALDDWGFREWLHGRSHAPSGMRGQSWNAAAFLLAQQALAGGAVLGEAPAP